MCVTLLCVEVTNVNYFLACVPNGEEVDHFWRLSVMAKKSISDILNKKDRLDGYGSLVCFPYKKTIEPSTHPSFPEFLFFFFWFSFRLLAVGNNFERLF